VMVFAQLGAGDLLYHLAPAPTWLPDGSANHHVIELEDFDPAATGEWANLIRLRQVLALKAGQGLLLRATVPSADYHPACMIAAAPAPSVEETDGARILTHRSNRDEDVRTIWLWPRTTGTAHGARMGTQDLLAQLLTYGALLAATIEYCEILKRRVAERQRMSDNEVASEAGLRGIVRVFLADAD